MAVYLIPVFIVSLVLIALVIFYVISERVAFKELQSGFPEEFAANGMNAVSVQSQALSLTEHKRHSYRLLPILHATQTEVP